MYCYIIAMTIGALSDVLCVFFVHHELIPVEYNRVMDVMLHVNLINLVVFFIMYFCLKSTGKLKFNITQTFGNKHELMKVILFAIPIVAACYKTFMMGFIKISSITIAGMIRPLCTWTLAVILLKEHFKSEYLKYIIVAIIGFTVANYDKLHFDHMWFLTSFVLIASLGDVTTRYYCRQCKDPVEAMGTEFILFAVYSAGILSIGGAFSMDIITSPYVVCIAALAFSFRVFMVNGVRRASSIVAIELLGFSKVFFTLSFSCLLLNDVPTLQRIIGALIIIASIVGFHNLEKRNHKHKTDISKKLLRVTS